ncbi:MAG TPA: Ig-like domain-containing protein [Methylomirabilota bacterium]|nr:Ig-like domain-containing protein [Methylomirabilota bacterium]
MPNTAPYNLIRLIAAVALLLIQARAGNAQQAAPSRPEVKQVIVRFKDNTPAARKNLVAQRHGLSFHRPQGRASIQALNALSTSAPALLDVPPGKDASAAAEQLSRSPEVLYAEPNFRIELANATPSRPRPNDFDYGRLWGFENANRPGADIHIAQAWARTTGSSNVLVAIIDTGIDFLHPDLAPNIWNNSREVPANGIDDDRNGFIDDVNGFDFVSHDSDGFDDHGHGTHVAGTVGAVGNNSIGVVGVCWDVRMMALKAFDETGSGNVYAGIQAIDYAVANGARIINASWGLKESSRALRDAVRNAVDKGVIFIGAAGNDRSAAPFYPAAFDGVISVGATTEEDARAPFTNFGETLDVSAPGASIYSTLPDSGYGYQGGTSMAAPHVSGLAALILSAHPNFTACDVEGIILNTCDEIETTQPLGVGRINAGRALGIEQPLPTAALSLPPELFGVVSITGSAFGNDFASYALEIGQGAKPANWTALASASQPLTNSVILANFDTRAFAEGEHVIRLRVRNSLGQHATVSRRVTIGNVRITSPMAADVLRSGDKIQIAGRVLGQGRTYELAWSAGLQPGSWQTNGLRLTPQSAGTLAEWDTSALPPGHFYTLRLHATSTNGVMNEELVHMVHLAGNMRTNFPVYVPQQIVPQAEWRSLKVIDLDGDGPKEIFFVNAGVDGEVPAKLWVLESTGALRWTADLDLDPPYSDEPVAGDLDGDGALEIVAGGGQRLFAFHANGEAVEGWPIGIRGEQAGKALADLDGDGKLEVIAQSEDWTGGTGVGVLAIYSAIGSRQFEWLFGVRNEPGDSLPLTPAVGNMDDDPELEILAVTSGSQVSLFDIRTPGFPRWSTTSTPQISASPTLADVSGDGLLDVIIGRTGEVSDGREKGPGGLYAYDRNGQLLTGWPAAVQEYFPHSATLADLNNDGAAEVIAASFPRGRLHVFKGNGFSLEGWPRELIVSGSGNVIPSIADVNGDAEPDIVIAQPGYWLNAIVNNNPTELGGIQAWTAAGAPIDLSPGPLAVIAFESTGHPWHKSAPPVLTDLDGNGKLDIVLASIVDRTYGPFGYKPRKKDRSSIYAWEIDTPFTTAPWPMLHQNAQHTAALPKRVRTNAPPELFPMPGQKVLAGSVFAPLPLNEFVRDDFDLADALRWTVTSSILQIEIDANNRLQVRPPEGWIGNDQVEITVQDSHGAKATTRVSYSVAAIGNILQAPTISLAGVEDQAVTFTLELAPHLQVAHLGQPQHGALAAAAPGSWTYQPTKDFAGTDEFLIVVRDSLGFTAFGRASVQLTGINDPPTPFADQIVTDEDTSVTIDPLANDRDPEGDPLAFVTATQPKHGSIAISDGHVIYTPAKDYHGADQFAYTLADDHGLSSEATVSISVRAINDAPILTNQTLRVRRNSRLFMEFPGRDPEGDSLKYHVTKAPEHGDLWKQPSVADYYPLKGFAGSDSFTYVATDGKAVSSPAVVTIEILAENNPPKANRVLASGRSNQPLQITLSATDEDGDTLTFSLLSQPEDGVVSGQPPQLTFTPNAGFLGTNKFTYQASDPNGGHAAGEVEVIIKDGNTAPVALFTQISLKMNTNASFTLPSFDQEADPLEFTILTLPTHGQITGTPPHLVYTPEPGYLGPDRLAFMVKDAQFTNAAPGEVYFMVLSTNLPPEAADQATAVLPGGTVSAALDIDDPENDPIRCVILRGPSSGTLSIVGSQFTYRANSGFTGSDSFTYRPWDGKRYGNTATVRIGLASEQPPLALRFLPPEIISDSQMLLRFTAPMQKPVHIQSSTNLIDWTLVGSKLSTGTNSLAVPRTSAIGAFFRLHAE